MRLPTSIRPRRHRTAALLALGAVALTACGAGGSSSQAAGGASSGETGSSPTGAASGSTEGDCPDGEFYFEVGDCTPAALIDVDEIRSGGPPPDGIPPIDDPMFESLEAGDEWLQPQSPVMAIGVAGDQRAYPLGIMTWHEIANDTIGGVPVVITYCPLCNSGLAFERTVDGEVLDFGTSGRLYRSNLVMYDRQSKNLWSQFTGQAVVGSRWLGTELTRIPTSLISWEEFKDAAPDGTVLSRETGASRPYGNNPYQGYDSPTGSPFLFDGETDDRLAVMERIIGLGGPDEAAVAVVLAELADKKVLEVDLGGEPVVLFWAAGTASALDTDAIDEGRDVGSTAAFVPQVDGMELTFTSNGDGTFTDEQTASTWDLLGQASDGELAGASLAAVPLDDTFWFVWFAFVPDTEVIGADAAA